MNQKRYQKSQAKIDGIIAKLPEIEKVLSYDPTTYEDGCKYLTSVFVAGMKLAKCRQQMLELRRTGDFSGETVDKAVSFTDKSLDCVMERLHDAVNAIKAYEAQLYKGE